jgi:hypothetical protein
MHNRLDAEIEARQREDKQYRQQVSVQPEWCRELPVQQQSVLFLAARGPDGIGKFHQCKHVQRAYRGTVLVAAYKGRELHWGEEGDTFMTLHRFGDDEKWLLDLAEYFDHVDELPHHFVMHLMHGAEILGYQHPDYRFRDRWNAFYERCCHDMHVKSESLFELNQRLADGNRKEWDRAEDTSHR